MKKNLPLPGLLRHLWQSYEKTKDGRQKHGDLSLLAQAAERVPWPEAPELGREIAAILRQLDEKTKTSKHERNVRDAEICKLFEMQVNAGLPVSKSHERIADIFGMTTDSVRKSMDREIERRVKSVREKLTEN